MRPGFWFLICALSLSVAAVHAAEEKQSIDPPIDNVVKKVNAEQDEELYRQLTPEFQKAVSLAYFRDVLRSVRWRCGKLLTWTEQKSEGELKVYRVRGEKGDNIVKVAVDKEGRISGLLFTPDMSWADFGATRFLRIFLILVFPYAIRRIMRRGSDGEVGNMRQIMCALFGAVVGPLIIFSVVMPTPGRVAVAAVLGAATALIIGNNEALMLRLSWKKRQMVWGSFGAVFGLVMPSSAMPTGELMAYAASCTVFGAVLALFFGNIALAVRRSRVSAQRPGLAGNSPDVALRQLGAQIGDSARAVFYPDYKGDARSNGPLGAGLAGLVAKLRKRKKLVGLAARVMVDGQMMASAADGERKRGSGVPIELGDQWHIGSVTKSITATMIARLIESGQMQWSDSVGQCFPDAAIHKDWKPVTLRQLLTHTAGAPDNFSFQVRLIRPPLGPECTRERRQAVMDVIARRPVRRPGKKHAYSNVGYTIAGAMAEAATGVSWEELVKREVFEPLELTGAGFGPPKSPSPTLDQPRGHRRGMFFYWKVSAGDGVEADNTAIMGPAGTVHMTLGDLCTYATEHLDGELGTSKLLAAETYQRLHTPELDNYACGWVKKEPTNEVPHTIYWHNGSNTMWYALVVFIPDKNMVVAVTANDGDILRAESAAWTVVEASAKQFNVEGKFVHGQSVPA